MNRETNDWITGGLIFLAVVFFVGLVFFIAYDRSTGTSKVIMAQVMDKEHEHLVHHDTHKDSNGNIRHDSHTHDYYWVKYRRSDGGSDKYDVGSWNYSTYTVGQKVVVHLTVGGVTGREYVTGLSIFTGGEAN